MHVATRASRVSDLREKATLVVEPCVKGGGLYKYVIATTGAATHRPPHHRDLNCAGYYAVSGLNLTARARTASNSKYCWTEMEVNAVRSAEQH